MVHACKEHLRAHKGLCRRRLCRRPMQQAICEHQSSAGVRIWANLVSPHCIMVLHLPRKHVERPAILSAEKRFDPCSLRPTGCARVQHVPLPMRAASKTHTRVKPRSMDQLQALIFRALARASPQPCRTCVFSFMSRFLKTLFRFSF